jgi:ABC-2 type transport system permease protein
MGLPVSYEKIFLIKFVDNFFYSSSTLTLLGLSWLLGYGSFFYLPWYFYFFTMFGVMLPFMLIAGVLAVMTLMVLITVASRIGIRWLLALLIGAYLLAIYLYFRISNPVLLVQEVMKHYPDVNEYFGYLDAPLVRYLPNHWVSEFLYWTINGNMARAIPHLVVLLLSLAALGIIAGMMARKLYYRSWLSASDARALRDPRGARIRLRFLEFGSKWLSRLPTSVLMKRDFWLFFREPSQWLHLLLMVLLMMIFLVSVGSLDLKLTQPFLQVVSYLVVFLFNGFLIASVSLRFVFPAVSLESESFWCIRSSPISLKRLYLYKLLFALAFVIVTGEILAIASAKLLGQSDVLLLLSATGTALIALALTGLNLGAGAYFAAFKERNPIRIASSQGASLTFLISMIYLGAVMVILTVPLNGYFEMLIIRGIATTQWVYTPLAMIALLSLLLFSLSTRIGLRRIQRDF